MALNSLRFLSRYLVHSWIVAFTCLCFPVIILANVWPAFGRRWYALAFFTTSNLMRLIDFDRKANLFAHLTAKADEHRHEGKGALHVLEIGPGTCVNFQYYSKGSRISTVERNPVFQERLPLIRQQYPHLVIEDSILADAEHLDMVADNSVDVVVATYILCCATDPVQMLREFHRILKPVSHAVSWCAPSDSLCPNQGGYFLTHEYEPQVLGRGPRAVLWFLALKCWQYYLVGCHAGQQDMRRTMRDVGFDVSRLKLISKTDVSPTPFRTAFLGPAVKP